MTPTTARAYCTCGEHESAAPEQEREIVLLACIRSLARLDANATISVAARSTTRSMGSPVTTACPGRASTWLMRPETGERRVRRALSTRNSSTRCCSA